MIGSLAVTVPAAVWLLGQGPSKSDHHHKSAHKEESKEEKQPAEEPVEEKSDEDKPSEGEEKSEDSSSGSEDGKNTPDTSEDEGYEKPNLGALSQTNYESSTEKETDEGQKDSKPTESKDEKDVSCDQTASRSSTSNVFQSAKGDDEKSKEE